MISYEEALELILSQDIVLGSEKVPTLESLGRVISKPVKAPFDLPRFNYSAMDGFAFKWDSVFAESAGQKLKIIGESAAGIPFQGNVGSGECIRISTGAQTPESVDTVIPKEKVTEVADEITINESVKHGYSIRLRGEDVQEGDVMIKEGTLIQSHHLGLISYLNQTHVEVFQKPKVALLTSGEELRSLGENLEPHQIINSNNYYLKSRLEQLGCQVSDFGRTDDNQKEFEDYLSAALEWADFVVTTAGVSVGDHDVVPAAVKKLNGEVLFWKLALRPGKPMLFARFREKLLFAFPGNPVSVFTELELFLIPFLRKMFRMEDCKNQFLSAELIEDTMPDLKRLFFTLGYYKVSTGKYQVQVLKTQSSGNFHNTTLANCLVRLEPGSAMIRGGKILDILPFSDSI